MIWNALGQRLLMDCSSKYNGLIIQIFYWCLYDQILMLMTKPLIFFLLLCYIINFPIILEWAGFYPESHQIWNSKLAYSAVYVVNNIVLLIVLLFRPIGMPYVRDVTVFNPSNVKNLQLQTLSGDNAHFHASFSKPKVEILKIYSFTFTALCTVLLRINLTENAIPQSLASLDFLESFPHILGIE